MLHLRLRFIVSLTTICGLQLVPQWVNSEIETQTLDVAAQKAHTENDPPGHLKPLGAHRPEEGGIDAVDHVPDPKTFYEEYVKPGKPLLMKGQAKKIPAYELWTDEYLSSTFGHYKVDVEVGKKENRNAEMLDISLKKFIQIYKRGDVYLVQDLFEEMRHDFHLLKCMLCGGFTGVLQTAVMWFSSGGTNSVLHNDNVDNINCIIEGDKDFVMFDKKYKPEIERNDFVFGKQYSKVDVEGVDMYQFPGLRDLPWYSARMEKGDCMFIPQNWYHQVRSHGDVKRNLAINIWFAHLFYFNETQCEEKGKLPETQQLADFNFITPNEQVRSYLLQPLQGLQEVTLEQAIGLWTPLLMQVLDEASPDESSMKMSTEMKDELPGATEYIKELFEFVDANKDVMLTLEELAFADIDKLVKEFPEIFTPDVLAEVDEFSSLQDQALVKDEL